MTNNHKPTEKQSIVPIDGNLNPKTSEQKTMEDLRTFNEQLTKAQQQQHHGTSNDSDLMK